MITITTNCPYPPAGTQITTVAQNIVDGQVTNPGTLVSVAVPQPIAVQTGSTPMRADFYDTATGDTSSSPIASIDTNNGYAPISLGVTFDNGLYVVQRTPSSIAVEFD